MDITQTLSNLSDDATLITVNQRLARFLRQQLHQVHQAVVLPGDWIQSLTAWCHTQWQTQQWQHTNPPIILTPLQERILWAEVIDQTELEADLLNKNALLTPIQQAWQAWYQRDKVWQDLAAIDTPNVQCFYRLAKAFAQRCQAINAITDSELILQLDPNQIQQKQLYFAGFAEFTPQWQAWVDRLQQRGMTITQVTYPKGSPHTQYFSFANREQQITHRLHWAKAQAEQGKRVGIVVPALQQQRAMWQRLVNAHLKTNKVQLSGGEPLAQQYLIVQLWPHLLALSGQALPSQWAQQWLPQLQRVDWPGPRTLNSHEHQTVQQFYALLQQFGQLDAVVGRVSAQRGVQLLKQACQATLFQAESPDQPEIMILGVLESTGLCFDAIAVVDMDEHTFPSAPQHHAFLPLDTRQWQITLAQTLIRQWQSQCRKLDISYVRQEKGMAQDISRLFYGDIYHVEVAPRAWSSAPLVFIEDDYGQPLTLQDRTALKGGAGLIKAQALCPFQAYARYRWQLEALPVQSAYLDAATRGTIVHEVVAACWQQAGGKADNAVIKKVLRRWQKKAPEWFPPHVFDLEHERLCSLMQAWFACEAERDAFSVVGHEITLLVELANLPLQLRLDRVDELSDGSRIVFDYKTRKHAFSSWMGPRPSEPQLPLYAVFSPSAGAAFALLRVGECGFQGVTEQAKVLPQCKTVAEQREMPFEHWEDLVSYWREVLTALAQQVKQGYAAVDPKSVTEACLYCDFKPVCRV